MKRFFYGNEVSEYGLKYGYVDYRTLARSFNHVLNNEIIKNTSSIGFWETVNGSEYDEETDEYIEIYQLYIIDEAGVEILQDTEEIVFYNEELDMYVWGVTHYGTSWDYVLTDIKL